MKDVCLAVAVLCWCLLWLDGCQAFGVHWRFDCQRPTAKARQTTVRVAASQTNDETSSPNPIHVVVVGGGWAGHAAADALVRATCTSSSNIHVTLLDAAPRGKGGLAGGWRTPKTGRPVEAGIHGFWRDYQNTFAVIQRLGLDLNDVLTPYTPSVLYSQSGKVAVAPVIVKDDDNRSTKKAGASSSPKLDGVVSSIITALSQGDTKEVLKVFASLLPAPLDLALLADFNSRLLTPFDRLSGLGLLGAWADFGQEDGASWRRYDRVSAEDLFLETCGVTSRLYDQAVSPLLHVLPMGPGSDISAAAALSCIHTFALAGPGSFDVRWCRGSIAEQIFNPWAQTLVSDFNVTIRGNTKVDSIRVVNAGEEKEGDRSKRFELSMMGETNETMSCDAVILAVGGTAMRRLTAASPVLNPQLLETQKKSDQFTGVTCVAVRLFLQPDRVTRGLQGGQFGETQLHAPTAGAMESPVTVCGPNIGNIPQLAETGFCIYDLQRLQNEFSVSSQSAGNVNQTTAVAALEVDFFRADAIADLTDDRQVAELALLAVAKTFQTEPIPATDIVDMSVVRARNAVSYFCVGSNACSPPTRLYRGLYMAGDWIDREGHASWSTEKAVVTGRQAAQSVLKDFLPPDDTFAPVDIIPAPPDSPQLTTLRQAAKVMRSVFPPPGNGLPPSPWSFLRSLGRETG